MSALNYDRESYVFNYFDGVEEVKADPSVIYDRLLNDPEIDFIGEWQDMNGIADAEEKRKCYSNLVQVIDRAFDVKPIGKDGVGLTLAERWILAEEFITWINDVKKKLSVFPTKWQSSEEASSEQVHIQKPDLDSDSITEESKVEEPSQSA
jgi:hypothetical protein|tara:strand:- start:29 stop:481 length:453 start_codon:yes stop_codon:yes gene_type:complete